MNLSALVFKGLLRTLAGQFIDNGQDHAECTGDDFGSRIIKNAKKFFTVSIIKEDLPSDLAAVGVLCDDTVSPLKKRSYTFFIYIDSSKKHKNCSRILVIILILIMKKATQLNLIIMNYLISFLGI